MIGSLSRLYPFRLKHALPAPVSKLIPVPSEAYRVWDSCIPVENSPNDPPLTENDISEGHVECLRKAIAGHLHAQGGTRFIDKNTRNTRRIPYLNAAFPDAHFVHIVRDPRAVVVSFLRVDWWKDLEAWCCGNLSPAQWEAQGRDPVELAATIWKEETECALNSQSLLGDRYMRVRYEDFVADHKSQVARILEYAGVSWNPAFARIVEAYTIRKNTNKQFESRLSNDQQSMVKTIAAPTLRRMGIAYW